MDKEYLIKKWLNDDLTSAEKLAFEKLDDYKLHQKIIDGAQYFKASNIEEPADIASFYARQQRHSKSKNSTKLDFSFFLKIAASIVVVLGIASFFWFTQNTTIDTASNSKTTITLPDASRVGLNSESELVFNERSWAKNRRVQLKGEAFFEVAKGATFDVITDSGIIQVLGTKFNVKNRKDYFEVQCFEGVVRVQLDGVVKELRAGATFRKIGKQILSSKVKGASPEWMSNKSTFKSVPFKMVVDEFERQYNVVISLNNIDEDRVFTGGFVHDNLNDGLKSITSPLDISYQIDGSNNVKMFSNRSE